MSPYPPPPYGAYHMRVKKAWGYARNYVCEGMCGRQALDWALFHSRDGASPDDYIPLCRRCHAAYDGMGERVRALRSVKHWVSNPTRDAQGRFTTNAM